MAAVAAQDASSSLYSLLIFPSAPPLPPPSFSFLDRGEEAVEETAGEEAVEETAGEEAVEETAGETVCEQAEPQPKPAGEHKPGYKTTKDGMVEVPISGQAYANLQYQASRLNCFYPKGSEREGEPDVGRFLNDIGRRANRVFQAILMEHRGANQNGGASDEVDEEDQQKTLMRLAKIPGVRERFHAMFLAETIRETQQNLSE
ncbi:hypothetical protein GUITHDRAFT_146729 [Guillardia theta CCMP2712]|uniref:Uncharacterized protein n=2 Tax=Guillardia theta TaxID=55529 RepID=L1IGU5_GUITC|nr:hypothetical protein GUITHDRAFT_146729 [Guillardia theta CCMP2712]EKX35149.1 hypothetical protein GUITHDRAFT_146729 [Guillardia theta CCMP2712]|eukprot:XP_005822129.1 hypothetical protein GUITHDRAFT_146729 [Guillardia theta CCMP2712]